MDSKKKLKKPITSFILLSNTIFLPLFFLIGAAHMLGLSAWIIDVLYISLVLNFCFCHTISQNLSGMRFIEFVKDKFKDKLKASVIFTASIIQLFIFLLILFIVTSGTEETSTFTVSSWGMLIYFFFKNLFAGTLGEELGWRGFAQIELRKKHSPLMASLIIGFW